MILKSFNEHVRRAFSNSAVHYEVLSGMQYEIGRQLIQTLEWDKDSGRILDIGMGTGKLTDRLSRACPAAMVTGMDFADGMVAQARTKYESFLITQANALALPFREKTFDAVFSNLAYQWVDPLAHAFSEAARVLKKDGIFSATLFAEGTLKELYASLQNAGQETGRELSLKKLPSADQAAQALAGAGFRDITIHSEIIQTHFDDAAGLLKWLKSIGANRMNRGLYLGPQIISRTAEYYQQNFKGRWGVAASFDVVWMKGKV